MKRLIQLLAILLAFLKGIIDITNTDIVIGYFNGDSFKNAGEYSGLLMICSIDDDFSSNDIRFYVGFSVRRA